MESESESGTVICDDEESMLGRQVEETKEARQEWDAISERKPPKIMVAGLGGVGKSTLINQLLSGEEKVAEEGSGYSGKATTKAVGIYHRRMRNGVEATLFDTPGFGDKSITKHQIVSEMKVETETELDLLLYCISIEPRGFRVTDADIQTIRLLTNVFGVSLWNNAVFVLTFANEACNRLEKHQYLELTRNVEEELVASLKKFDIPNASEIPVVTAGHTDEKIKPHEDEDWIKRLFALCVLRIKSSAVTALLKGRLRKRDFFLLLGGGAFAVATGALLIALFGPLAAGVEVGLALGLGTAGGAVGGVAGGAGAAGVMYSIESLRDQIKVMWYERKKKEKKSDSTIAAADAQEHTTSEPLQTIKESTRTEKATWCVSS